ncbi:uncharacterized protein J3R85_000251 [Psidium guajava]|nr:uncharacterized protein J3R85_000251 [Psidium guajava]
MHHPTMQPLPFFNLHPPLPLTVPHCHSQSEPVVDESSAPPKQRRSEMVGGRERLRGRQQRTQFEHRRERVSTCPTSDGSGNENDDHIDDAPPWWLPSIQNRALEENYEEQGGFLQK